MPLFGDWIERTRQLQQEAFLRPPPEEWTTDDIVETLRANIRAAFVELGEFSQELPLKEWKDAPTPKELGAALHPRGKALEEFVDVLHFLGNVAYAAGWSTAEINAAYERKMIVNRQRQGAQADGT